MRELKKLYEIPNNSVIDVAHLGLETLNGDKIKELDFDHIDGAYSLCYWDGEALHLSASTEVYLKEEL